MNEIRLRLNEGRRTSTLTLPEAFELTLDADDTEKLIRALGGKRSMMLPKVPRESADCDPIAPENPLWEIGPSPQAGHWAVLRLRDPRYGWISFAFSEDRLQELINALINFRLNTAGSDGAARNTLG
jgi:hypothetical protein